MNLRCVGVGSWLLESSVEADEFEGRVVCREEEVKEEFRRPIPVVSHRLLQGCLD